jgi:hypothetical protein
VVTETNEKVLFVRNLLLLLAGVLCSTNVLQSLDPQAINCTTTPAFKYLYVCMFLTIKNNLIKPFNYDQNIILLYTREIRSKHTLFLFETNFPLRSLSLPEFYILSLSKSCIYKVFASIFSTCTTLPCH